MLHVVWRSLSLEAHAQGPWMGLNLVLAVLPGLAAILLHLVPGRRRWPWWIGAGIVLALLPNAPYVLTDVIHIRQDIRWAPNRDAVVYGLLPLYAVLLGTGVLSYALTLHLLRRELRDRGWSIRRRVVVEASVDVVCAVGVALGRIPRLNSWDLVRPFHVLHGLEVIAMSPRFTVVALAAIVVTSVVADRVASGTVHLIRDRTGGSRRHA